VGRESGWLTDMEAKREWTGKRQGMLNRGEVGESARGNPRGWPRRAMLVRQGGLSQNEAGWMAGRGAARAEA
jgi:hypothetical protein